MKSKQTIVINGQTYNKDKFMQTIIESFRILDKEVRSGQAKKARAKAKAQ